jgi:tRNA threonylcarbamoyladenosine biosynthesis protein TsaB
LLERIQRLLLECDIAMPELDGIAVATGPGSFNGVRVALATAKTLAFTLQKPLLGVSTLDVIAGQQQQFPHVLCAVMEAGRSELYAACYRAVPHVTTQHRKSSILRRLGDYGIFSPAQLGTFALEQAQNVVSSLDEEYRALKILFCGEISNEAQQALYEQLPEQSQFVHNALAIRHASVLATLAFQLWQEGEVDDPLLLEPLYLRRPSITTSTKKRPLLGSPLPRPTGQRSTEREEGAVRN